MLQYFGKRMLLFVPTLLIALFLTYMLSVLGPLDPLLTYYMNLEQAGGGRTPDAETLERLREAYGLDRPFIVQFADWASRILRGDLGRSYISRREINPVIGYRFPISAQLGVAAFVVTTIVGTTLGVVAALKHNTWVDNLILGGALFLGSFPQFVLAPLSMIVVMIWLNLPSVFGWEGIFNYKAILPVLLFSIPTWVGPIRMTRSGLLQVLSEDYVRTARAKGLPERLVILRHILKNGLTGTVTSLGLSVAGMVTGSVFIETAFGIPGYGSLLSGSINSGDYNIIMAVTLIGAVLVMIANLITDLIYGVLDPRVRYE